MEGPYGVRDGIYTHTLRHIGLTIAGGSSEGAKELSHGPVTDLCDTTESCPCERKRGEFGALSRKGYLFYTSALAPPLHYFSHFYSNGRQYILCMLLDVTDIP